MALEKAQFSIYRTLLQLAGEYNRLTVERDFLTTGVAARLAIVNALRQEVVDEAQIQLDRLNTIRVANGLLPYTLTDIRNAADEGRLNT